MLQKEGVRHCPLIVLPTSYSKEGIAKVRAMILRHTNADTPMFLLFDNIDKGWPAKGISKFDIRLVRLLLEALEKIKRDFHAAGREFLSVVFFCETTSMSCS